MRIGKLRHRVQLQHLTQSSQDTYGEPTDTWTKYSDCWASVEPMRGRELEIAQQVNAEVTIKVTIRYNSAVLMTDRIVKGSRNLEIVSIVNPEERNEKMILMCKEML